MRKLVSAILYYITSDVERTGNMASESLLPLYLYIIDEVKHDLYLYITSDVKCDL